MFKASLVACIALLGGAALADGVPLITAAPKLAASDSARQLRSTKEPNFVALHPITLNKRAFGANVLTLVVEGKEYRFVGSMMAQNPPTPKAVTQKQPISAAWSGREPGGGTLTLTNFPETGELLGIMRLPPARTFNIASPPGGAVVLVETDANIVPPLFYNAPLPAIPASGGQR